MATNVFWIGYHSEKFRGQVAIWKKRLISRPVTAFKQEQMFTNLCPAVCDKYAFQVFFCEFLDLCLMTIFNVFL